MDFTKDGKRYVLTEKAIFETSFEKVVSWTWAQMGEPGSEVTCDKFNEYGMSGIRFTETDLAS